jgi:tRNA U34 5-methylaminomethyl-2-thiouridine-forming methyltransferase MnmC
MQREIIQTYDGSSSVLIPESNLTYHSIHGAIQESRHVFINAGLIPLIESGLYPEIKILEMGFGTGLNALLTLETAEYFQQNILYTTVELIPLTLQEVEQLNYPGKRDLFRLHKAEWNTIFSVSKHLKLFKLNQSLLNFKSDSRFHLIYYDAFAPDKQPELWTTDVFLNLILMLESGGILVTYSSAGKVRRAMQSAGFRVDKIQGPPHKREMIRAIKEK